MPILQGICVDVATRCHPFRGASSGLLRAARATLTGHRPPGQRSSRQGILHSNPSELKESRWRFSNAQELSPCSTLFPSCSFMFHLNDLVWHLRISADKAAKRALRQSCQSYRWSKYIIPPKGSSVCPKNAFKNSLSCNRAAKLPRETDRELPSSPSCQLQGMLCVNLLTVKPKGCQRIQRFPPCDVNHQEKLQPDIDIKSTFSIRKPEKSTATVALCLQCLASPGTHLAFAPQEYSNTTDPPSQHRPNTSQLAAVHYVKGSLESRLFSNSWVFNIQV